MFANLRWQAYLHEIQSQRHNENSREVRKLSYDDRFNRKLLAQYVLLGDQEKAEDLIDKFPRLLLYKSVFIDYSGRSIKGTPYQMALGAEDVKMAKMIQSYLLRFNGASEVVKQQQEQFPNNEINMRREQLNALITMTNVIFEAKVGEIKIDKDGMLFLSEKCKIAMDNFRYSLYTKDLIETGKHFNSEILKEAFETYKRYYKTFGGVQNSPKNILFWCQIIGYIQRFVPACYAQAFARGKARRNLMFMRDSQHVFYPLDKDKNYRLGYDYAIPDDPFGCGKGQQAWFADELGNNYARLVSLNKTALDELMQSAVKLQSDETKNQCVMS